MYLKHEGQAGSGERERESWQYRQVLDSVLMVYNKLKGRREETRVIVVESSLQSGTSAETNEGIC